MRLLALETSGRNASVAVLESQLDTPAYSDSYTGGLEENELHSVGQLTGDNPGAKSDKAGNPQRRKGSTEGSTDGSTTNRLNRPRRTSSSVTLIRMIKEALEEKGWKSSDVDVVAVTIGPGSFTGLRIGLVTAKTFGYAAKARVVGVNTLEAIATQTRMAMTQSAPNAEFERIKVAIDAGRNQLFVGQFAFDADSLVRTEGTEFEIIQKSLWFEQLGPREIATGPALFKMEEEFLYPENSSNPKHEIKGFTVAPQSCWSLSAAMVGMFGATRVSEIGESENDENEFWKLSPLYMRPSYAEE